MARVGRPESRRRQAGPQGLPGDEAVPAEVGAKALAGVMRSGRLGLCVLALATAPVWPAHAMAPKPPREITETKDRLTLAEMEAYVAGPLALARADDMAGAGRALNALADERARRYGADSIEFADTLNGFMIVLFGDGRKTEALAYAPRVIDAVRRAWGSDHLEYALTLVDVVQMDYVTNGDAVGAQAEAAMREAYRIRLERLGPTHKETISTLIYLGRIQGLRSRTGGDLTRATPALQSLRGAIAAIEADTPPATTDNIWARNWLAEVYARNGALDLAVQAFNKTVEVAAGQGRDALDRVDPLGLADALVEAGLKSEADTFLKPFLTTAPDPPAGPPASPG